MTNKRDKPPRRQRTHRGCPGVVHLRGWPKIKISQIPAIQVPHMMMTRERPRRTIYVSQSTSLSIMDKFMLFCCQMSQTSYQIDPKKSASRKYPLQLFCELTRAVLDEDTGDLLEYRHLVKHPKHKKVWGGAFGK